MKALHVLGFETVNSLDCDVGMTNNPSGIVEILRSGVVGIGRIGEGTSGKVLHLNTELNRLTSGNIFTVLRVGDNGGDHVIPRRNAAHGNTVAATTLDLLTIGKSLSGADVDEVGRVTRKR